MTAPDLSDPVTVHANMLRGTIAKPTVEQIIHLYGVDALTKALAPVIVREAPLTPNSVDASQHTDPAVNPAAPLWPDFVAPPKYENPDPRWVDPDLPDFRLIWKVARECGYAVGLHGSMKRDCDMIAAPWTDEAVVAFELIERLCAALNAKVIGPIAGKPHGRLGWNLQVDGYVKVIDISVMPRSQDRAAPDPVPEPICRAEQEFMERFKRRIDIGGKFICSGGKERCEDCRCNLDKNWRKSK